MAAVVEGFLREQLHERRQLLEQAAAAQTEDSARLQLLLTEVGPRSFAFWAQVLQPVH